MTQSKVEVVLINTFQQVSEPIFELKAEDDNVNDYLD